MTDDLNDNVKIQFCGEVDTAFILGMMFSEAVFRVTGFGPSRTLCDEFAGRVIAEAESVNHRITLDPAILGRL